MKLPKQAKQLAVEDYYAVLVDRAGTHLPHASAAKYASRSVSISMFQVFMSSSERPVVRLRRRCSDHTGQ